MKIDDALIDRLATLSKLRFEGEAKDKMKADLERMLQMVSKLDEVDTKGVDPLIYITEEVNRLREDEIASEVSQEEALRNAPSKDSYYYKVPKVIKGES